MSNYTLVGFVKTACWRKRETRCMVPLKSFTRPRLTVRTYRSFLCLWSVVWILILPASLLHADLWEIWQQPVSKDGWYSLARASQSQSIDWVDSQGVHNTPFVFCDLESLEGKSVTGDLLFPLYTFNTNSLGVRIHPVHLLLYPSVTIAVNDQPLRDQLPADLGGGTLRFFVGEWNRANNYAFYVFKPAHFEVGDGQWTRSTVTIVPDSAYWDAFVPAQPDGPLSSLPNILRSPQQWGVVIVGAGQPPTHYLGFDDLRIARRFTGTSWDLAGDRNGMYYNNDKLIRQCSEGGIDNTPFVYTALRELSVLQSVYYPLWTWVITQVKVRPE